MNQKYVLTDETIKHMGKTLRRIKAIKDFSDVKSGDLGGFVESEKNLDSNGNAWVAGDARVSGNARVAGDARVSGNACVYDDACVYGDARVYGNAWVAGNACVYDDARVSGNARVAGNARVSGNARVAGNARVSGNAVVFSNETYMVIGPIGSRNDSITFTRDAKGFIYASVGCFHGTLQEFRKKVSKTHGDNVHAKAYMIAADLAEARIDTTPYECEDEFNGEDSYERQRS